MRHCLLIALTTLGAFQLAHAVTIVPGLEFAAREYGMSGMYSSVSDSNQNSISDFQINGRWGLITTFGVEAELETGYGRRVDTDKAWNATRDTAITSDLTSKSFTIGGNLLYNWNVFDQTTLFGIVGYRYVRNWSDQSTDDPAFVEDPENPTSTKMSYKVFHYGLGLKYYFVPNAGIRLEYRIERARGLPEDVDPELYNRKLLLLGISIYQ